jgi:hypothetical protein
MKPSIFIYSVLLFLSIGCTKKETQPAKDSTFLSAYKNTSGYWLSNEPYASISKKDKTIWVGATKPIITGTSGESLIMQLEITDLADLKKTFIKNAEFDFIIGGDVVTNRYYIDTANTNNTIEITEIDETKKIMKGLFNLNLIRDKWFSDNGEKIEFKSGQFVVNYSEE